MMQLLLTSDNYGEVDLTEFVAGYEFSTLVPYGFYRASVELVGNAVFVAGLADQLQSARLTLRAAGGVAWQGRVNAYELRRNEAAISAEGEIFRLADLELWRCYASDSYALWMATDSTRFTLDGSNQLAIACDPLAVYAQSEAARFVFPASPVPLGKVLRVTGTLTIVQSVGSGRVMLASAPPAEFFNLGYAGDAIWEYQFRQPATSSEAALSISRSASVRVASETTLDYTFGGETFRLALPAVYTSASVTVAFGAASVAVSVPFDVAVPELERVAVVLQIDGGVCDAAISISDLTISTFDNPTSTALLSEAMSMAGIPANRVQSPNIKHRRAVYQQSTPLAIVETVATIGDGNGAWVVAVYENGYDLRAWGDAANLWMLTPQTLAAYKIGNDRATIYNAVRAMMGDASVTEWQEDAASIARYGRRERTIMLPQMSAEEADQAVRLSLSETAEPATALEIQADALIARPDGSALYPAWLVRAGDRIVVRDVFPEDRVIDVKETSFDGRVLRVVPRGIDSRLEVLLAARDAAAISIAASGAERLPLGASGSGSSGATPPAPASVGWESVTGKPSTFPPSAHTHAWESVTGKPSTFPPSAHTHSAGDIATGTLAIARLPSTVVRTDSSPTFTAPVTLNAGGTVAAGQVLVGQFKPANVSMTYDQRTAPTLGPVVTHFRGDTGPPAGYSWQGTPYSPSDTAIWFAINDFCLFESRNKSVYLAKTLSNVTASTPIFIIASMYTMPHINEKNFTNSLTAWIQIDDGTENNLLRAGLRFSTSGLEMSIVYSLVLGGVVIYNNAVLATMSAMTGLQTIGVKKSNNLQGEINAFPPTMVVGHNKFIDHTGFAFVPARIGIGGDFPVRGYCYFDWFSVNV